MLIKHGKCYYNQIEASELLRYRNPQDFMNMYHYNVDRGGKDIYGEVYDDRKERAFGGYLYFEESVIEKLRGSKISEDVRSKYYAGAYLWIYHPYRQISNREDI